MSDESPAAVLRSPRRRAITGRALARVGDLRVAVAPAAGPGPAAAPAGESGAGPVTPSSGGRERDEEERRSLLGAAGWEPAGLAGALEARCR